jgi:hypothetical protein
VLRLGKYFASHASKGIEICASHASKDVIVVAIGSLSNKALQLSARILSLKIPK